MIHVQPQTPYHVVHTIATNKHAPLHGLSEVVLRFGCLKTRLAHRRPVPIILGFYCLAAGGLYFVKRTRAVYKQSDVTGNSVRRDTETPAPL